MTELFPNEFFSEEEKLELPLLAVTFLAPHVGLLPITIARTSCPSYTDIGLNISLDDFGMLHINMFDTYYRFIFDGLYLFLSDMLFFPDIGKSSHLMTVPSIDYNPPNKWYNDLKLDLNDVGRAKFDEKRKALHSYLFKVSLSLLILHECQHYLNGHSGFYVDKGIVNGTNAKEKRF